ncbi:MAG: hypothetical protein E6Q36_01665 [Chryseobacterium sp.]|nr:MAG: hypothetical protein E6Q36_01665 [Chryseobacterium sp.]
MKNYTVIISFICLFLFACIYFRTGYFESSIQKTETTFYIKGKDPITSKRYYRDLSGNWILLDKNIVITKDR